MLRDSVVVVVRTRPRAIPLAMITIRKILHGFPFLSHDDYGAPLGGPSGRRSSAITCSHNSRQNHNVQKRLRDFRNVCSPGLNTSFEIIYMSTEDFDRIFVPFYFCIGHM